MRPLVWITVQTSGGGAVEAQFRWTGDTRLRVLQGEHQVLPLEREDLGGACLAAPSRSPTLRPSPLPCLPWSAR